MKLNRNFRLDKVGEEQVLVNTTANKADLSAVFSLNEPAAWLWRRIGEGDFSEKDCVDWILSEYEVSRKVAEKDVHSMVLLWRRYGMVID